MNAGRPTLLSQTTRPKGPSGRWAALAPIPGLLLALLPVGTCAACLPAYAAVLSSLGIGTLPEGPYLFPLTAALLGVGVGSLGWRAKRRRGHRPLLAGIAGAGALLAGRFAIGSSLLAYAGLAVLLLASIWSAWPVRRTTGAPACSACAAGKEKGKTS